MNWYKLHGAIPRYYVLQLSRFRDEVNPLTAIDAN